MKKSSQMDGYISSRSTAINQDTLVGLKVFCPTGIGGGVDATCSPGKAPGYNAPQKNADGYVPGTVGGYSGVSTAGWNAKHAASQKIMKKIAILEEAAAAGKWGTFQANLSGASMEASSSKLLKTLLTAQQNLLAKKTKEAMSLPAGAEPAKPKAEPDPADAFTMDDVLPPLTASDSNWKKVGGSLGTEKGGVYEMGGKKYYVKQPDDVNRAKNEVLTNRLYQLAGADTSKMSLLEIDGKLSVASEWVEGAKKIDFNDKANQVKVQSDYAAHVWLNNRDAIGAGSENPEANIVADKDGNPKIVDTGGGLDYGGMGGGGKKNFDGHAEEWSTMVNPKINPTMAKVFGGMSDQQKLDSLKKLDHISYADIDKMVSDSGVSKSVAITLKARLDVLRQHRDQLSEKLSTAPPAPPIVSEKTGPDKNKLTKEQIPLAPNFITKNSDMKAKELGPAAVNASSAKTEKSIAGKASSAEAQTGLDKIGHYAVVGKIEPFVPAAHTVDTAPKKAAQWTAGKNYYKSQDVHTRDALKSYTGGGYSHMNSSLRKGEPSTYAILVAKALMNGPVLKEGTVLTRKHGLDPADMKKLLEAEPGTIIQEKGILSTSTKPTTWSGAVTLKITTGKGVKGLPAKGFSKHPGEDEVMLPPNTKFLITKTEKSLGGNYTTVHVVALPTEDNQCCPP